ncbi:hypothetical protein LCGC14_1530650 [marine sediment metagenome]|uniref:Sialidase domain-containing protein n=1 Tax=marine sediment metagenome TaxID=412755 RepID=A0A0F9LWV1_9ZZZZ
MADIKVTPNGVTVSQNLRNLVHRLVWTSITVGYYFYFTGTTNSTGDIYYVKTTDSGTTWGSAVQVNSDASSIIVRGLSTWYDQWTPGNSGDIIHIGWSDCTEGGINAKAYFRYRRLNTSGDSLGTQRTVDTRDNGSRLRGYVGVPCVARSDAIYYLSYSGFGTDFGSWKRSTDAGANWTTLSLTNVTLQWASSEVRIVPGNDDDADDMYLVKWSPGGLFLYWYDYSGDVWTATVMDADVGSNSINLDSCTRVSDKHSFVVYNLDDSHLTLECIEITGNTTSTQRTNILTDTVAHTSIGIGIDPRNDLVVVYGGLEGGGSGIGAKKSQDDGVSWTSETQVDEDAADVDDAQIATRSFQAVGTIFLVWTTDSSTIVYGNTVTFVLVSPSDKVARVTGLVHHWAAGPNPVYQLEIMTGGLFSQYFSPISATNEPEPTIPVERKAPVWRPTLLDYGKWLADHTHAEQVAIFGEEAVSFADWSRWAIGLRAMGRGML